MTKPQIPAQEATRGRGRPSLPPEEKTVNGSIRLTPSRWAKLRRLGNGWLSKKIDQAKEPKDNAAPQSDT